MNYPKELAILEVKTEIVRYAYDRARYYAEEHDRYTVQLKEEPTSQWLKEQIAEMEQKNEAYKKIAETLAK